MLSMWDVLCEQKRTPPLRPNVFVHAQNVFDYLAGVYGYVNLNTGEGRGTKIQEILKAIPSIAPPFPCYWVEFVNKWGFSVGVYVQSYETKSAPPDPPPYCARGLYDRVRAMCRWAQTYSMFGMGQDRYPFDFGELFQGVFANGSFDYKLSSWCESQVAKNIFHTEDALDAAPVQGRELERMFLSSMVPVFMVAAFMTCANVERVLEERPRALAWTRRERRRDPTVRFHVLKIKSMIEVLRGEGDIEREGLPRALHICRGHFKSYEEGNGLFGREDLRRRFWFSMHARGKSSAGIVAKDYDVDPRES